MVPAQLIQATENVAADSKALGKLGGEMTMDAGASNIPTFDQYLEESVVERNVIDQFLQGPGWAQFDPEVGYVLSNSLQPDGVDHSSTFSTIQANGARRSFMYPNKKPRINAYGNSFTLCHQVSDGETWEEYLAAHLGEPVGNLGMGGHGVYQAYRRMIREEQTDHAAPCIIFYIWGDDPIRSLFRARWASSAPRYTAMVKKSPGFFHNNFWSNVEMNLNTGQFVEKAQLLPTKDSVYRMTDSQWMVEHLKDDLAVQLSVYGDGLIRDLDREKVSELAARLDFPFDWSLLSSPSRVLSPWPGRPSITPMQAQAAALLDQYALRATVFILEKAKAFAEENNKKLLVVLFDPYRALFEMKQSGTRYDQQIVDYLVKERVNYFDMNEVHLQDFKKLNLTWEDYLDRYFIGHYKPAGNHFFAFSIKDRVVQLLDPKPIPYQRSEQQSISFKSYLNGYQ